jgi:hypothetical protein
MLVNKDKFVPDPEPVLWSHQTVVLLQEAEGEFIMRSKLCFNAL